MDSVRRRTGMMHSKSYGDHQTARSQFKMIPGHIRRQMVHADYSEAQRRCPQNLPVGSLVIEADTVLA